MFCRTRSKRKKERKKERKKGIEMGLKEGIDFLKKYGKDIALPIGLIAFLPFMFLQFGDGTEFQRKQQVKNQKRNIFFFDGKFEGFFFLIGPCSWCCCFDGSLLDD